MSEQSGTRIAYLTRGVPHYRLRALNELATRGGGLNVAACGALGEGFIENVESADLGFAVTRLEGSSPRWRGDVRDWLERVQPEAIILEHGASLDFTWTVLLSRTLRNVPRVLWTHGIERHELHSRRHDLGTPARWLQMRLAAGIVCYETKLAERVRRSLPRKVVGVAPNTTGGFGRPTCGRDGRANLKKALCLRREFYLVGLGRLVAEKEFDRLPYILARVRAAGLDAGLILVGEGPARVPIERRAADLQLAQGDIVFTGAIGDQQALANWLGAADIHVHPGAIGLAVVDAHFAGIPTVIPSPGRKGPYHGPEWSYIQNGETGWVVEENTDESLAQVVVDYLRKPAAVRDEMSERCADYARRNLGIEQMVDGIIETIELVLRSRKA